MDTSNDAFQYAGEALQAESVDVTGIAERFGTPCYVYSRQALESNWRAFDEALSGLPHLVCYAVKANANLAVLDLLARLGSGFDIVSVGELERVLAAGGDPGRVVFSGPGKGEEEMRRALEAGIHCFNVESQPELERLHGVAEEMGYQAPVAVRVNPDVDPGTHPYIATGLKETKFGVDFSQARALYEQARRLPHISVEGVDCHIGSQLTDTAPFREALERVLQLVDELEDRDLPIGHIDVGGGFGIVYGSEQPPSHAQWAATLEAVLGGHRQRVLVEPGRAVAGNAGILLTRVDYVKDTPHHRFAVVDAAMNDLLRPALYEAWHDIVPVRPRREGQGQRCDVVGPVCETADFLGHDRELNIAPGDLLAVRSAGAYGFVMSSNYNARPRAAEVMVDGEEVHLVRERETIADLMRGEQRLPDEGNR